MAGAAGAHLRGVGIKHTGIVGLAVNGKELLHLGIDGVAVVGAGLLGHADAAVGHHGTLEGLVGLEANDFFLLLVQVAGTVGGDGGDHMGVHIQNTAGFPLLTGQVHDLLPQGYGVLGGAFQEGFVTFVLHKVVADEAS